MLFNLWIITIIAFSSVTIFLYLYHRVQMKEKNSEINELQTSVKNLENKLEVQESRAFRLRLFEHSCTFEFIEFGDPKLSRLKHRQGEGIIRDISSTGLQLITDLDLPVRKEITLQMTFAIEGEKFVLPGKLVRKEEGMKQLAYGLEFISMSMKDQQRLIRVLQKLEIKRRN